MDWIHCNNCFMQLEPGITLHLTSCGHMFCNNCLNNGVKESTCLVCRAPCSMMKLVPDMSQEIQDYFTEPEELIKKCCEVFQFQRQHRRRLLSYLLQSTKKFYKARTELQRMTEICQKQHKQLKEYQKMIKMLESQLSCQPKPASPFSVPISPTNNVSPSFIQTTPTFKRNAKSTPYTQPYQSDLVTPVRISHRRCSGSYSGQSQRSNTSNKISSTVLTPPTPPTPQSAGSFLCERSFESGYASSTPRAGAPRPRYCSGYEKKCSLNRRAGVAADI